MNRLDQVLSLKYIAVEAYYIIQGAHKEAESICKN